MRASPVPADMPALSSSRSLAGSGGSLRGAEMTMGKSSGAGAIDALSTRAAFRQLNNCEAETPCRRATQLTEAPGRNDSATIVAFSSSLQRRRRSRPNISCIRPR